MIQDLPEWERPREKLMLQGAKRLSDAELIAILISSGSSDGSAISLAEKVLSLCRCGVSDLASMEADEFIKLKGIGVAKACSLVAAMELGRRIAVSPTEKKIDMKDPESVSRLFMEEMRHMSRETVRVALVDVKGRLTGISDISIGGLSESSAHPRDIFSFAVKKSAAAVIIAHNHPSGDCTPSAGDIKATSQLAECGKILGIRLLDHIIIGDGCFTSMYAQYKELF